MNDSTSTPTRPCTDSDAEAAGGPHSVPDIIRAHSFELVDKDGNARAQFGFGDDSGELAQIVFLDPSGEPRVGVTCDRGGAAVGFLGSDGIRMALMSSYADDGDYVVLDLADAKGGSQFSVRVSDAGTVTMGGWPGWANETLQKADVASDALKLLASEVSGFMRPGDRVVADDEDDELMQKLAAGLHRQGREERSAFIRECSKVDTRVAALEAAVDRVAAKMERLLRLRGLQANVEGSMVDKMLQEQTDEDDD